MGPVRILRRPLRIAVFATFLVMAIIFFTRPREHILRLELFTQDVLTASRNPSTTKGVASLCRQHGFSTYSHPGPPRKVYDLLLLSQELEWLQIRLHTLAPYVDYFVVVEATKTYTALPKPMILKENWENFTAFHPKLLHYVVEDTVDSTWTWDHEDFIRNALLYNTFPHMRGGEQQPNDGDVLVVSDIDEIPKPETMVLLRHCDIPARLTLRSQFYYYSFQWLHRGEQWAHPQSTIYRGLQNTICPVDLRNGDEGPGWLYLRPLRRWWEKADLWNATWHCSSCFRSIKEIRTKMGSFSHTPWNTEENRDPKTIVERVRKGLDLFGRETELYDRVEGNRDVPKYILEHPEKYGYMLDRDGEDAAFEDYHHQ